MSKKIDLNTLYDFIESRGNTQSRLVISLDGNSCGGKTTLANLLSKKFGATLIHIDDFYKPRNKNQTIDLTSTEGNIDYDRFVREILNNLKKDTLIYNRFNCSTQRLESPKEITLSKIVIIEGTYSTNPRLNRYFDASVFVEIDDKTQIERIKKRNPNNYNFFYNTWVKLERNYFSKFDIKNSCDYVICGIDII